MKYFLENVEKGRVPDWVIRLVIRKVLRHRFDQELFHNTSQKAARLQEVVQKLREGPLVSNHEVGDIVSKNLPVEFYKSICGPFLKTSCCFWPVGVYDLRDAEREALRLAYKRAELVDGMQVLDFGCGWGAFSLRMAERFPKIQVTSVTHSQKHKAYLESECERRGLGNIKVIQSDIETFETSEHFDRIFSIEALVHQVNLERCLHRFGTWLKPDGKVFVQLFCHRENAYPLGSRDDYDWMNRYFITAGIMPSDNLLLYFQRDLILEYHWRLNGVHYSKTAEAWLSNLTANKDRLVTLLEKHFPGDGLRWYFRWRMFFLTMSELFKSRKGNEWWVSHYLFTKRKETQ